MVVALRPGGIGARRPRRTGWRWRRPALRGGPTEVPLTHQGVAGGWPRLLGGDQGTAAAAGVAVRRAKIVLRSRATGAASSTASLSTTPPAGWKSAPGRTGPARCWSHPPSSPSSSTKPASSLCALRGRTGRRHRPTSVSFAPGHHRPGALRRFVRRRGGNRVRAPSGLVLPPPRRRKRAGPRAGQVGRRGGMRRGRGSRCRAGLVHALASLCFGALPRRDGPPRIRPAAPEVAV